MSEERLMILRMVQDGKITPEQGESLLKALPADTRQESPAPPPPPPSAPGGSGGSPFDLSGRIADVQSKLGELQAKLGAAQSSAASSASAGKKGSSFPFNLADFDISGIIDEAVKGVSSLKVETVRTAKMAARSAQKEARKIRTEARRSGKGVRIDVNVTVDSDGRPENVLSEPEQKEVKDEAFAIADDGHLSIFNALGDIKVVAAVLAEPRLVVKKTAWGAAEELADMVAKLTPVLTYGADGKVTQIVVDPMGVDPDHVIVDLELTVPETMVPTIEASFGNVHCEGLTGGLGKIETASGDIRLFHIHGGADRPQARVHTRSGNIAVNQWSSGRIELNSYSGEIKADGLSAPAASAMSRSGLVQLANIDIDQDLTLEAASGDIVIRGGQVKQLLSVRTQSGDVSLKELRSERAALETVSGDLKIDGVMILDGGIALKSVAGDMEVKGLQASALSVATISGDVALAFAAPFTGTLSGNSVSGDVCVKLWSNSAASLEMSSQSGSITCDLPLDNRTSNGARFLAGSLGGGTGSIKLQSVSGDLVVKQQ